MTSIGNYDCVVVAGSSHVSRTTDCKEKEASARIDSRGRGAANPGVEGYRSADFEDDQKHQ